MLRFKPDLPADGTILCLGAHCDDIEIGCGATLRMLQDRARKPTIDWVVSIMSSILSAPLSPCALVSRPTRT